MSFERPLLLLLLVLCLVPLLLRAERRSPHPALGVLPADPLSRLVTLALRLAAILLFAALALALAGPHLGGGTVAREGVGANIVLLFDRSSSMNDSFAGRAPDGDEESKSAVARRLLRDFVDRRPHDRIGVAAFSTSPMAVMPMTDHLDAVRGAVDAIDLPGLAHTDVGSGLAMALTLFADEADLKSRALILVSDGAAVVERKVQDLLRTMVKRDPVNLYWLFIRTRGSPGLFEAPGKASEDTPHARPERHLHIFLQSLGIPYRALEAESPEAIGRAIAEIDRLETRPITYLEQLPRRDLAPWFYRFAAVLGLVLLAAILAERTLVPGGAPLAPVGRPGVRRPGGGR
ncbi:vWA domain-containing protein [Methylobrevis pamukkalensis]|uniref:MxaC protein n=1 Tax=Methylobrevis pamukkalensis TaxID=1439726 RepID=A0A1E3H658_9HYPH|nr:vWA domain-containing protein [Methylobrevis pamukkalensis]ODN71802.1 mxaC protein [Methylobrevis pamukkalensis]